MHSSKKKKISAVRNSPNTNGEYPDRDLIRIGYEELREYVINCQEISYGRPPGLSLFFRLGMFGWLEEARKHTALHHSHESGETRKNKATENIFPDLRNQVVNLLSNMVLGIAG